MTLRNRVDRLEDTFGRKSCHTDDEWDGIFLFVSGMSRIPWSSAAQQDALRNNPAYCWAQEFYAERGNQVCRSSDAERGERERKIDALFQRFTVERVAMSIMRLAVRAWKRQIPSVQCPVSEEMLKDPDQTVAISDWEPQ
jgi:hypothetical protein